MSKYNKLNITAKFFCLEVLLQILKIKFPLILGICIFGTEFRLSKLIYLLIPTTMSKKTTSIAWWIIAFLFTVSIAIYQRMTGPTYPARGSITIENTTIKYGLLRSSENDKPAEIIIKDVAEGITADITYKRFKIEEELTTVAFSRQDQDIVAYLPPEPAAGKLEYTVTLYAGGESYELTEEPVVIRFKGPVPSFVLLPHIVLMFLAMLFSTRTGIEALRKGDQTLTYTGLTLLFLLVGGMILGPLVQKYAFDDYWTGWPFGKDLTDNKTLVAFVAWIIAYFRIRKKETNRWWAVVAAVILLAVYMIPHSMFGSELDYASGEVTTGK